MTTSLRANGYAVAWVKGGEGRFLIHRDCYERLLQAWIQGSAFVEVLDLYQESLTLKLGEVAAIGKATPRGVELYEADEAELRLQGES